MSTIQKPDVRFTVFVKSENDSISGPFLRVTLNSVVVNDEGKLRNADSHDFPQLNDLTLSAQLSTYQGKLDSTEIYGWSVDYRQPFSVGLREAEAMVTLLRKVDRHMAKLDEKWGRATDFAAWAGRVADALGVTSTSPFVRKVGATGRDWQYDDSEWRYMDVDTLRYHINHEVTEFVKTYKLVRREA